MACATLEATQRDIVNIGVKIQFAPLLDPPVSGGMTDTLSRLKAIIMKEGPVSQSEYTEVPVLLRRLRYLLRAFYDAKIMKKSPVDPKYYDLKSMADVGLQLHRLGIYLQLKPARLRALCKTAPDTEVLVLDEPMDIGKWRKQAHNAAQALLEDPESNDSESVSVAELEVSADDDLAAFEMVPFVADVLVAFIQIPAHDNADKRRKGKALKRLVEFSTCPLHRSALGDYLADSMRPLYGSDKLTQDFVAAGGLPALVLDWAESFATTTSQKALDKLHSGAWQNQSVESLQHILRGLIHKVEKDVDEAVVNPLFVRIVHEIYSRYGKAPFERGSQLSHNEIIIFFLWRRFSSKPNAYKSPEAILGLLKKYRNVPWTTRQRHGWMTLSISGRWDCIEMYGCKHADCPERQVLLYLKEKRIRAKPAQGMSRSVRVWTKADWKTHKETCKEMTTMKKEAMEVEI
ncbi:hypothetical protein IEO21_09354 [Rhodonia placenta]|uniref:Uncharacterized protein n=1 Tax=Rhodonia placenta TaxID=104341 RepID=A0A8H7NUG0_9APHY|nr:hypothetical protein IEO21_09354 [Postia placenta]